MSHWFSDRGGSRKVIKRTPGAWYAVDKYHKPNIAVDYPDNQPHPDENEKWANIVLMAAAPELLEAVKAFVSFVEHNDFESVKGVAYDMALKALEKAEKVDE